MDKNDVTSGKYNNPTEKQLKTQRDSAECQSVDISNWFSMSFERAEIVRTYTNASEN